MPRPTLDGTSLALAALVAGSTAVRFALSLGVEAPWIAPDEQLYGLLGRSLVSGEGLTLLGERVAYYSLLYPLLVGVPLVLADASAGVSAVQALQALVMSGTAIPVYLWARPVSGPRWALVAAGLTVLIPGLAYSGLLMSETLYYLAGTLAAWALAACLHRPTFARQALLLAAIGVALLTRLQAIGFVGAIVLALAILVAAERSFAPLRRLWPILTVMGAGAALWIGSRVVLGGVGELLGAYAPLTEAGEYSVADVLESIAWQTGALTLLTIGIPLVALGILTWNTVQGRERDPRVRALVVAALAYAVVTVVEVGAFASRFVEHVTERQLLSVAPPVFVAFAVWLRRGAPRPQPLTSIATIAVAASALLLPLDRLTTQAAYADAPSMIPLERISSAFGASTFEAVYALGGALVLVLAVLLPRRAIWALPAIVAAALTAGSLVASLEIRDRSQVERERTFAGAPADWVDASGAEDVTLVLTGERFWPSAWEELFWNESIAKVVRLPGVESPGVVPQEVAAPAPDGRLTTRAGETVEGSYAAAPRGLTLVGDRIAEIPASFEQPGMVLWRGNSALRASHRIVGFRPNGDLHGGESAVVRVFGCGAGRLELTLLGKQGAETRILLDGDVVAARAIPPEGVWRPSIPTPPDADGSSVCVYRIETDGLIGSTRVDFVRG